MTFMGLIPIKSEMIYWGGSVWFPCDFFGQVCKWTVLQNGDSFNKYNLYSMLQSEIEKLQKKSYLEKFILNMSYEVISRPRFPLINHKRNEI